MPGNPTIVFTKPGEVVIEDRDVPSPEPGEMLIRTTLTLISTGTELTILSGEFPSDSAWSACGSFPHTPGYCNVGGVEEVGTGVDASWKGRRVSGTQVHAAWVMGSEGDLVPVPDGVTDAQAAFRTMAVIAMNGVRRGGIVWGETVVIYGLGLVGQFAARFAALSRARPVFGVDVGEKRLALLPDEPCYVGVNGAKEDVAERIKEQTRGRMADIVFEVTGAQDLIAKEFAVLRRQGRMVLLSSPRGETLFDFHDFCNAPSFTIIGAHMTSAPRHETPGNPWTVNRNVDLYFDHVVNGEIDVDALISHRQPAERAPDLYKMLLADRSEAMGVLLDWSTG